MIRIILIVAGAFLVLFTAKSARAESACFSAVQNRVAWNAAGNTAWNPANVRNLCSGAEDSVEPAACFETVMQKRVSHGEGYQWSWSEATELCRGTRDFQATISCFKQKITQGVSFARARAACQWRVPPASGRAKPPATARPTTRVGDARGADRRGPATLSGRRMALQPSVLLANTWRPITFFERSRSNTTGTLRWATGETGPFVLSGFRFRFENGDHELQRMALRFADNGYDYSRMQAAFRDGNGDDPYAVQFRYANINKRAVPAGTQWEGKWRLRSSTAPLSASEKAKLNGACMNGDGMVPLLTGFDFSQSAKDVKVRRLAAICAIEPVQQCKSTFGWKNAGPGGCAAGVQSRNTFRTIYRKSWTDAERFDMDDFSSFFEGRRFYGDKAVKVDRVFVPLTAIDECGFFYARDSNQMESFARGRPVAIQGFDFRFLDTDHNLLEAGLMPQESGGNQVSFRDNDGQDPFEYRVQLCALKPLGAKATAPVASRIPAPSVIPTRNFSALRFQNVSVNTRNTRTSAILPSTVEAQKGVLLSSFFLGFENGDHKIKTIGVMPVGNTVQFNYADGDGDDPFTARAQFIKPIGATLPVIPLRSTDEFGAPAYTCNDTKTCTWVIGSARGVPKKFIPVLSGFYFDRQATDANIGGLSAGWFDRMRGDQGGFQALMTEDGGWDWRQTESQIDRQARNTLFRGSVALVPAENIERCGTVSRRWWGESRRDVTQLYDSVRLLPNKRFVLQRISFGFAEDHFLQHIGVQYRNDGELRVYFKDNNRDDYYWWSVGYCYLKD